MNKTSTAVPTLVLVEQDENPTNDLGTEAVSEITETVDTVFKTARNALVIAAFFLAVFSVVPLFLATAAYCLGGNPLMCGVLGLFLTFIFLDVLWRTTS